MDLFGEAGLYIINTSGEELKLLISVPDKWIAYLNMKKQPPHESMLNVINMESGESKIVTNVQQASFNTDFAWSPDGKRFVFGSWKISCQK